MPGHLGASALALLRFATATCSPYVATYREIACLTLLLSSLHALAQVSQSGLDAIIQRMVFEGTTMGKDNYTDINLNSTRLDLIFKVRAWN